MRSEQPEARVQTCLTCGTRVEVVSTDEGTHHYRPARDEGLSDEDRARLETMIERAQSGQRWTDLSGSFADLMTRALALIDHQAKALEAADEARVDLAQQFDELAHRAISDATPWMPNGCDRHFWMHRRAWYGAHHAFALAAALARTTERTTDV